MARTSFIIMPSCQVWWALHVAPAVDEKLWCFCYYFVLSSCFRITKSVKTETLFSFYRLRICLQCSIMLHRRHYVGFVCSEHRLRRHNYERVIKWTTSKRVLRQNQTVNQHPCSLSILHTKRAKIEFTAINKSRTSRPENAVSDCFSTQTAPHITSQSRLSIKYYIKQKANSKEKHL